MLTVVHDADSANDNDGGAVRSLLDEIVRDGARQMLAAALQAEVAAYIDVQLPIRSTRTVAGWWSATVITSRARC